MGREPLTPFTSVEAVHRICCTYALDACVSASLEQLSGKLSDCKKIIANGALTAPLSGQSRSSTRAPYAPAISSSPLQGHQALTAPSTSNEQSRSCAAAARFNERFAVCAGCEECWSGFRQTVSTRCQFPS